MRFIPVTFELKTSKGIEHMTGGIRSDQVTEVLPLRENRCIIYTASFPDGLEVVGDAKFYVLLLESYLAVLLDGDEIDEDDEDDESGPEWD